MNENDDVLDTAKVTQLLKDMLHLGKVTIDDVQSESVRHHTIINGKDENDESKSSAEVGSSYQVANESLGKKKYLQEINFTGLDEACSFPVFGNEVLVRCSPGNHTSGSSKIKIKTISNSGWDNRYYIGQQVAVNRTGEYVAYALKIPQAVDGAIRVVKWKTKVRQLLRGMRGQVVDLAFSYYPKSVLLASVDEFASVNIHEIKEQNDETFSGELLVTINRSDKEAIASMNRRVVWCLCVPPDDEAPDDFGDCEITKRLAVAHKNLVEIYNLDVVLKENGNGPLCANDISSACRITLAETASICDVVFSPEGTAVATVSTDGTIVFFQICHSEISESKFLHNWNPHNGKPLSSLLFLDNIKTPAAELWKFAVTGADRNRELKLWNCQSWQCLQTINLSVGMGSAPMPELKVGLDSSAEYLFLSDVARSVLYVLNIYQDAENNTVQVSCISEFLLSSPMLSFVILSACQKRSRSPLDDDDPVDNLVCRFDDEQKDKDEAAVTAEESCTVVKLVYVQPKSLQEARIKYCPVMSVCHASEMLSSVSLDTSSLRDQLSDVSYDAGALDSSCASSSVALGNLFNRGGSGSAAGACLLLPPESFSTLCNDLASSSASSSLVAAATSASDLANLAAISTSAVEDASLKTNLMDLDTPRDSPCLDVPMPAPTAKTSEQARSSGDSDAAAAGGGRQSVSSTFQDGSGGHQHQVAAAVHSAGSSPSLEVQEILNKDLGDDQDIQYIDQDQPEDVADDGRNFQLENLISLHNQSPAAPHLVKAKCLSPQPTMSNSSSSNENLSWPAAPSDRKLGHFTKLVPVVESTVPKQSATYVEVMATRYDHLSRSVQALVEVLDYQKQELQLVRQDMAQMRSALESSLQNVSAGALQNNIGSSLKNLLQKHRQAETSSVMQILKNHEEKILSSMMQTVNNTITARLDTTVRNEFKNSIRPAMIREVEKLEKMMHEEVTKKLSATDNLMKENLKRLAESKAVVSSIAQMVTSSIQGYVRAVFHESFQALLLPAFDQACQAMFLQIDSAFRKGTKEYTDNLESRLDRYHNDGHTMMTSQMHNLLENVNKSTSQVSAAFGETLDKQLHATLVRFEEGLAERLSLLLQKEMSTAIQEHQSVISNTVANAIRSRAVTPSPALDRTAIELSIVEQLQRGEVNAAFQQALSASDLHLVMFVCERVSPSAAFSDPHCVLQQPVVLSLIHHLSADLGSKTELKQDYLQEALVNLDIDDPQTSSHIPTVLNVLQPQLRHYVQHNAGSKLTSGMRVLLMASQSLMQRIKERKTSDALSAAGGFKHEY